MKKYILIVFLTAAAWLCRTPTAAAATSTLFTVPYNGSLWGSFQVGGSSNQAYAFRMVTSSDFILSATEIRIAKIKIWDPAKCGGYCYIGSTDRVDAYLYTMPALQNLPSMDLGQRLYIGSIYGSALAADDAYYTKTVYSVFPYPVFAGSVTSSRYWISFEPVISTSTSAYFRIMTRDGYLSTLSSYQRISDVWTAFVTSGSYKQSPNGINVYGSYKTFLSVDQFGGVIISNTTTGAWFNSFCTIDQDFGWWSPVVQISNFLFCPDPSDITAHTEGLQEELSGKIPFGWWNQVSTNLASVSSTYTNATSVGMFVINDGAATHTFAILDMQKVRETVPEGVAELIRDVGTVVVLGLFGFYIFGLASKSHGDTD